MPISSSPKKTFEQMILPNLQLFPLSDSDCRIPWRETPKLVPRSKSSCPHCLPGEKRQRPLRGMMATISPASDPCHEW